MKAHKTESCTGKTLPSFGNCCVGLYLSRISLSPSLWAWVGTWGGKLTEWTPCQLTIIGETRWDGGLTQDWAILLVSEHLKVWGLCKRAPGFFFPQQIHSWPALFLFSCRPFILYFIGSFCYYTSCGQQRPHSLHMWRICEALPYSSNPLGSVPFLHRTYSSIN